MEGCSSANSLLIVGGHYVIYAQRENPLLDPQFRLEVSKCMETIPHTLEKKYSYLL